MRVYSVQGAPPEIQAYALAKYSRSAQSMQESIEELSTQRAEQFLNTFYFQYGHRSIADLAHVTLAIEDVSILAAFHVSDESLWDGQSRSSRYQDFRKNGFYQPPTLVEGSPESMAYQTQLQHMLTTYETLTARLMAVIEQSHPRPETMTPATYTRTIRARAFDIARYVLPLATKTSLGQITSARTIERQISRLGGEQLPELRDLAEALRTASREPGYNFIERKLGQATEAADIPNDALFQLQERLTAHGIIGSAAAPTLVKYSQPDAYTAGTLAALRDALAPWFARFAALPATGQGVSLQMEDNDPARAFLAVALYVLDPAGRAYGQWQQFVAERPAQECEHLFTLAFALRGEHDDWLRLMRTGYAYTFDLLIDFGSLRDLHRHRRCVQVIPHLKATLGFDDPADILRAGLGEIGGARAIADGIDRLLAESLTQAADFAAQFPDEGSQVYLLPLGLRQRALFKMDLAEIAYIVEQRTAPGGHFSYRRAAWQMYEQICARHSYLVQVIRAQRPDAHGDLLQR